jgi:hypothetical protein
MIKMTEMIEMIETFLNNLKIFDVIIKNTFKIFFYLYDTNQITK